MHAMLDQLEDQLRELSLRAKAVKKKLKHTH